MQTFMPYSDFEKVARCLDMRRLGKQRVETWQIYKALTEEKYGWKNHPIVKMWSNYKNALLLYGVIICREWKKRGYKDTMEDRFISELKKIGFIDIDAQKYIISLPFWINNDDLNISHQSNLVRKFPEHYNKYFNNIPNDIPYVWII